jgi:hypothetical protein
MYIYTYARDGRIQAVTVHSTCRKKERKKTGLYIKSLADHGNGYACTEPAHPHLTDRSSPPRSKTPHKKANKTKPKTPNFQQAATKQKQNPHLDLGAPRVRSGFGGRPRGGPDMHFCGAQKLPNGGNGRPHGDKPRLGRPSPLELRYAASISAASERHRERTCADNEHVKDGCFDRGVMFGFDVILLFYSGMGVWGRKRRLWGRRDYARLLNWMMVTSRGMGIF